MAMTVAQLVFSLDLSSTNRMVFLKVILDLDFIIYLKAFSLLCHQRMTFFYLTHSVYSRHACNSSVKCVLNTRVNN